MAQWQYVWRGGKRYGLQIVRRTLTQSIRNFLFERNVSLLQISNRCSRHGSLQHSRNYVEKNPNKQKPLDVDQGPSETRNRMLLRAAPMISG